MLTKDKIKDESELAVFWDEIAKNLPKSQERSALGDEKIFTAFKIAYPKIKSHLSAQYEKLIGEVIGGIEYTVTPDPDFVYKKVYYEGHNDAKKEILSTIRTSLQERGIIIK